MKREKCPKDKRGAAPPRCKKKPAREGSQNDIFYEDDRKYALIGHKDARPENKSYYINKCIKNAILRSFVSRAKRVGSG